MENNEKRPLKEDWRLIKRAISIWNEIAPHYWFWQILCVFADVFIPYFGIYMSAALVTELGGDCNPKRLTVLAAVTVVGAFLMIIRCKCNTSISRTQTCSCERKKS